MPLSANSSLFHAFICYRIAFSAIPHQSETKDPDPHPHQSDADLKHCIKQSRGRSQWRPGGSQIPITLMKSRILNRNRIKMKSWIHILITAKSRGSGSESALKQYGSATLILRFLGNNFPIFRK
jgi:hypothetical protein